MGIDIIVANRKRRQPGAIAGAHADDENGGWGSGEQRRRSGEIIIPIETDRCVTVRRIRAGIPCGLCGFCSLGEVEPVGITVGPCRHGVGVTQGCR